MLQIHDNSTDCVYENDSRCDSKYWRLVNSNIKEKIQEILVTINYSVFIKELYGVINDCNLGRSISKWYYLQYLK